MSTTVPARAGRPVIDLADLGPLAQLRAGRLPRRLSQLFAGLGLYGASLGLMVEADLGLAPWDVLHSGVTRHVSITLGQAVIATSFAVLLLWVPLREKPGVGTIGNAIIVGLAADATIALLDAPEAVAARLAILGSGIVLCGLATAIYIGAQLGRGPRDGLMTGLHRRTGLSIRLVRTAMEAGVVVGGLALGGAVGLGTVVFALSIGPLAQLMLPWFLVRLSPAEATPAPTTLPIPGA